jgi:hypothetical protein
MSLLTHLVSHRALLLGAAALFGVASSCQQWQRGDTALLRLKFIDDTLLNNNNELWEANGNTIRLIETQAVKNQNQPTDIAKLRQAKAVHDSTRAVVNYMRDVREQLLRQTGTATKLAELDAHGKVAELLEEPHGTAATLQRRLNQFTSFLKQVHQVSGVQVKATQDSGGYSTADFDDASLASALATLSQRETAVLLQEQAVLAAIRAKVGATSLGLSLKPLAIAEASTVAPGATYRAELLLAHALNAPGSRSMTVNGAPITVGPDGHGQVSFTAPRLNGAAVRQAYWNGTITSHANGRDSTFRIRVPYTIVRK